MAAVRLWSSTPDLTCFQSENSRGCVLACSGAGGGCTFTAAAVGGAMAAWRNWPQGGTLIDKAATAQAKRNHYHRKMPGRHISARLLGRVPCRMSASSLAQNRHAYNWSGSYIIR